MKKIQGILTAAAFTVAIVGAFAFNSLDLQMVYKSSDNGETCTEATLLPPNCTSILGQTCTIGNVTYYQDSECENEYYFKQ